MYNSNGPRTHNEQVVAAMIALINDHRLANKKPTLGFLNPMLYSENVTRILNDVTEGSNPGCGTTGRSLALITLSLHTDHASNRLPCEGRMGSGKCCRSLKPALALISHQATGLGTPDFLRLLATLG